MVFLLKLSILLVKLLPISDLLNLCASVCLMALQILIDELRK